MNRLLIVARLQDGKHAAAKNLLRQGPPFDAEELGFHRHGAFLTATEVVFFFEAPEVEWILSDLIDDPVISASFAPWQSLIKGSPRMAHEHFYWSREETKLGVGLGV